MSGGHTFRGRESVQRLPSQQAEAFPESGTIALFDTAQDVAPVVRPVRFTVRAVRLGGALPANDNAQSAAVTLSRDSWLTRVFRALARLFVF